MRSVMFRGVIWVALVLLAVVLPLKAVLVWLCRRLQRLADWAETEHLLAVLAEKLGRR